MVRAYCDIIRVIEMADKKKFMVSARKWKDGSISRLEMEAENWHDVAIRIEGMGALNCMTFTKIELIED